jgi:hypothetical protein
MKINHITQSVSEAANPAQQAAIAVNMKRAHKKPKTVSENYTPTAGELARDLKNTPDDAFKTKYGMSKQQAAQHYSSSNLKESRRDQDDKILRLFTGGKSPEAIAAQLSIDVDTVNDYINNRMPDSQDNSPRGYSSNRNVGQGMNEQFDPATKMMWIDQVSQLAQAVSQMSPEELVKLNDAFQGFYRVAGGAAAGAASVGIGAMFYELMKDTLYAAKRKARVDTEEILQLKRQIISIHKTLKRVKSEKAVAKYQAMLKQAFEVLGELEARQGNKVAEGKSSSDKYVKLLKNHDWTYDYGDDQEAQRGYDERQVLLRLAKKLDPKFKLWNKYAPDDIYKKNLSKPKDNYDRNDPDNWYDESVEEGKTGPGLWANIHAKQNRIKSGSGEHMRKPGSKGAPKSSDFKKAAAKNESSNYGDLDEAFNLEEEINKLNEKSAAWQKKSGKSKSGGLNQKGVNSYRREHPGSKLQTAVTTKPSKLKPGSKPAKRRKSFCARMSGVKGPMKKPNGKPTRKALALRKWNC